MGKKLEYPIHSFSEEEATSLYTTQISLYRTNILYLT